MDWNFGEVLERLDARLPGEAPILIHGDQVYRRAEVARRTNALARALREGGAQPGDKIALYMRNGPAYGETLIAALKARLVQVNVNFRYRPDELHHIIGHSDARFVVFDEEFAPHCDAIRERLSGVDVWIQVGGTPAPFARDYEAMMQGDGAPLGLERSGDDLLLLYTGGTTGYPKGVMWRQHDLWGALGGGSNMPANRGGKPASLAEHLDNVASFARPPRQLIACPLMHGTALFTGLGTLCGGGAVVTLPGHSFDAADMLDVAARHRIDSMVIVGDAFARPIAQALEAEPERWDLTCLKVVISSGVMFSSAVKQRLIEHWPHVTIGDLFGSSEAVGFGSSSMSKKHGSRTARFRIGDGCRVFTADHREVRPGSDERGLIARSGPIPLGYYKDPEASARTFPTIDGVRYSMPGDWCTVEADGTLTLLGRGSVCINTAGEKVYPEEVEEALKTHPAVRDTIVVGLPDERYGQAVTAVVELQPGARLDSEGLRSHARERLASYKIPRRLVEIERVPRSPSGKPDFAAAREFATRALGT